MLVPAMEVEHRLRANDPVFEARVAGLYRTDLVRRGIVDAAAMMEWLAGETGWNIPCPHLMFFLRKHLDTAPVWCPGVSYYKGYPDTSPKYRWYGAHPAVRYYAHPYRLQPAIQQAKGLLHIVNGAPAVLACHAAGVHNVLSWYRENRPPGTIAHDMRVLGVQVVLFYPDKDNTGERTAQTLADVVGVPLFERTLPDHLPKKADVNDALMDTGPVSLNRALRDASYYFTTTPLYPVPVVLAQPAPKQKSSTGVFSSASDKAAADRNGWRQGEYFSCPWADHENDRDNPRAVLNVGSDGRLRVHCYKCDRTEGAAYAEKIMKGLE